MLPATISTNAGSTSSDAAWRVHSGGSQITTGAMRAWPYPQTMSANPASDASVYRSFHRLTSHAGDLRGAPVVGEDAHRVDAEEQHESGNEGGHGWRRGR